jgi:hypothetical protein
MGLKQNKNLNYSLYLILLSIVIAVLFASFIAPVLGEDSVIYSAVIIIAAITAIASYLFFFISILIYQYKNKEYFWFVVTLLATPLSILYFSLKMEEESA